MEAIANSPLLTEEDQQLLQFVLPIGVEHGSDEGDERDQLLFWSRRWSVFLLVLSDQSTLYAST